MRPRFSVVVPVYNVVDYLPACIDSIVRQGCAGVEIILVDDHSTDGSGAVCDRYARNFDHVQAIHQEKNRGVAAARNRGLAAAAGDYVVFVDADDCLADGALNGIRRTLEHAGEVDIVICRFVSQSGVLSSHAMFIPGAAGRVDSELVLNHLIEQEYYLDHSFNFAISLRFIANSNARFIDSTIAEDAEFIVRLMATASSMCFYDGDFYWYRERDGSLKNTVGVSETASFLRVAGALRRLMETTDRDGPQQAFIALQIGFTYGAFFARLALLDDADMPGLAALAEPEDLPPSSPTLPSDDVFAALTAHRKALAAATLSLVAARNRPLYLYCTGPNCEAVLRSLQSAGYAVRHVIDDNPLFTGRTMLGVPIATAAHFCTLAAGEIRSALVLVCNQRKGVFDKIVGALTQRGIAREQIVHRVF